MGFFADYPYWLDAVFAMLRVLFWMGLLYGFIAPLFLSYTRKLPFIERVIYTWVGIGGILLFWSVVLVNLHIYDLFSIALVLLLNPFIVNFTRDKATNVLAYLKQWELKSVVSYIRFVENKKWSSWHWHKVMVTPSRNLKRSQLSEIVIVVSLSLTGAGIRLFSVLQNAAPLSSGWFSHLNRVKNIRLQEYSAGFPDPGGMHLLVDGLSLLTQVSPEMILHLFGGISTFLLCIIVYWSAKDITKNSYPQAAILGLAVYALTPLLFMPVSFDQQIDAGSLDLALCFAVPTMAIFVRNIRNRYKSPWFYPLIGFTATAIVDLFVAYVILLPMMLFGLGSLPRRNYGRSFTRVLIFILTVGFLNILPYLMAIFYYGIDFQQFLMRQLYNIQIYNYFPSLVLPMGDLSLVYMIIAGGIISYCLARVTLKNEKARDELVFLILFILVASLYLPGRASNNSWWWSLWFDVDQFNSYFAILTAMFISIAFSTVLEIADRLFKPTQKGLQRFTWGFIITVIFSLIYFQGGLKVSRTNPETIPNGFMEAYYGIIAERQPYTYATVGPKVQQVMAKNRHYFMEYRYFLSEYRSIDSLYREQLKLPDVEREGSRIPPASIFVFAEKPPYESIQQGILYNSASVMQEIEQWIADYRELPGRRVNVFYSDENTTVYELINRPNESEIEDILYNIYPEKDSKILLYE